MPTRKIDKKSYFGRGLMETTKARAKKTAKNLRKDGFSARVLKHKRGYTAFARKEY